MKKYILLFVLLAVLTGCRSSRQLSRDGRPDTGQTVPDSRQPGSKAVQAQIGRLAADRLQTQGLTANAKVKLTGIGKDLGVSGRLFMKRNEVIRLSLRVFGIEVGLLEFTPQEVLVVDRVHKQYVRVAYSEVNFLRQSELDFHAVQALFWNELFVPGKADVTRCTDRLVSGTADGRQTLHISHTSSLDYTFYISADGTRIDELLVRKKGESQGSNLSWKYGQFEPVGANRTYPLFMSVQARHHQRQVGLCLDLSNVKLNADGPAQTQVSPRYTQRSVDEVLKGLKL